MFKYVKPMVVVGLAVVSTACASTGEPRSFASSQPNYDGGTGEISRPIGRYCSGTVYANGGRAEVIAHVTRAQSTGQLRWTISLIERNSAADLQVGDNVFYERRHSSGWIQLSHNCP